MKHTTLTFVALTLITASVCYTPFVSSTKGRQRKHAHKQDTPSKEELSVKKMAIFAGLKPNSSILAITRSLEAQGRGHSLSKEAIAFLEANGK